MSVRLRLPDTSLPEHEIDVSVTVTWHRVRVQAATPEAAQLAAVEKVRMLPDDLPSTAGPFVTTPSKRKGRKH